MFRKAFAHLMHRINPVTIARETATYATDKFIPQGAAELAQGLVGNAPAGTAGTAYVPYGHAQAPVPATGKWSDRFSSQGRTGPAQERGMGM